MSIMARAYFRIGGGGGNRTRVRRSDYRNLYRFSSGFIFAAPLPQSRTRRWPSPLYFPLQRWSSPLAAVGRFIDAPAPAPGPGREGTRCLIKQRKLDYRWRFIAVPCFYRVMVPNLQFLSPQPPSNPYAPKF